jgi:hypothetical protein
MIEHVFSFADFKSANVDCMGFEESIASDGTLPPLSHVETRVSAGGDAQCKVLFVTDTELSDAQAERLSALVAAHDSEASHLANLKLACKADVDVRTHNYHAIRAIAAMSAQAIDDAAQATKDAIDAASSPADCVAAAATDPRPTLKSPVVKLP